MAAPRLPTVSFANETGYDSDEFDNESSSQTSSSTSGVIIGFDDGEMPPTAGIRTTQQQQPLEYQDESDITVSRIGGRAYIPLPESLMPPQTLNHCPLCTGTLTLLAQIYAPLQPEKVSPLSPPHPANRYREEFDRVLYILGCLKKGCIGVRCLRAALRNGQWAREGQANRQKVKAAEAESRSKAQENPFKVSNRAANPFASNSNGGGAFDNPFASSSNTQSGFGSMIFGSSGDEEGTGASLPDNVSEAVPGSTSQGGEVVQNERTLASSSLSSRLWLSADSVPQTVTPPRYLSTDVERLSNAASSRYAKLAKQVAGMSVDDASQKEAHKDGRPSKQKASQGGGSSSASGGDEDGWSQEAYEIMRVSGVEEVFLAFQERLEAGGAAEQVIRYDFGGVPLPYSGKSKPYSMLWREAPTAGHSQAVTRQGHAPASQRVGVRHYDARCTQVPKCPHCGSSRTFEAQLMPNMVNIIEKALEAQDVNANEKELGWATVWCFVCSADCLDAREAHIMECQTLVNDTDEDGRQIDWSGWREEIALVELES